jgi:hypothetical protein
MPILAVELTRRTALGALGEFSRLRGNFTHLTCLDLSAELLSQFVGAGLEHGVMRDADDRPFRPVQGDRDFGGFAQQLIEFLLQNHGLPIHGLTPSMPSLNPPKSRGAALYHEVLTFSY